MTDNAHRAASRRTVLKTIGATTVGGLAATGTAAASHIDIWVWRTTNVSSGNHDAAVSALDDAIDQLNRNAEFAVSNEGSLSGSWPSEGGYSDYVDEFDQQRPFTRDGDLHYLIYREDLIEGDFSFEDDGAAGNFYGHLKSGTAPKAIANSDVANLGLGTTYENFVKQEFLHAILDSSHAPDTTNEHSFGSQYGFLDENSPMLTGYAEDVRGGNSKPDECCNMDWVATSDYHNGTLSNCTKTWARDWVDNEY